MKTFMGYPIVVPTYKEVDFYVIYTGPESIDLTPGKKYHCRGKEYIEGELDGYDIQDRTGDYFLVSKDYVKIDTRPKEIK